MNHTDVLYNLYTLLNPCQAYSIDMYLDTEANRYWPYQDNGTAEVSATREYYPCILYKKSTSDNQTLYTIESMHGGPYSSMTTSDTLECRLSFNCEKNQKVFYKLKKDCSYDSPIVF